MVSNITYMNDCLRKNGHLTLLVSVLKKWKHNGMCFLDILICLISMGSVLYLFADLKPWMAACDLPVLPNFSTFCIYSLSHEIVMFNLSSKKTIFFLEYHFFLPSSPHLSFLLFVLLFTGEYFIASVFHCRHWEGVLNRKDVVCPRELEVSPSVTDSCPALPSRFSPSSDLHIVSLTSPALLTHPFCELHCFKCDPHSLVACWYNISYCRLLVEVS